MFHVILHQPEIPPNTGNVIRLCANSGCTLHLIEPLGFDLDSASVRRAGLDYAELALLRRHRSIEDCLQQLSEFPEAYRFRLRTHREPLHAWIDNEPPLRFQVRAREMKPLLDRGSGASLDFNGPKLTAG